MNVSSWSIRNPIAASMVFVLLTFAGLIAFGSMKVQNFPDIDLPMVTVSVALPGTAPAQMETEVARKVENAIATTQGLKHIYTVVQQGVALVQAEYRLEKSPQEALDDVRQAVQGVRGELPATVRDPVIQKVNMAATPVLAYTVASDKMTPTQLSWFVDNEVSKSLLAVRGVGAVSRVGGVSREVAVTLDAARMQALGVTAADVSRQLRLTQQEASGGRVDWGTGEQSIRTLALVQTAAELENLEVALGDGRHVRLSHIATITDGPAEARSAAYLNGQPVVGFEISRSKGESEIDVGRGVRAALENLRQAHPDVQIHESFDFVTLVQEEYDGSISLLIEGALLAVLVVWLFLRDWRATFVSAVALPLSVIPAFIGMQYLGFTVNTVTLLALSLVIGILVDDAIVEVENIVRHLRMGKTPYQAAMEAADEIGLAVIATTFTLVAVFLPTAFMTGIAGKFFKQFGWTASLAVLASLLVARMLTPMMAAYMLKPLVNRHEQEPRWMQVYLRAARWCMRHRWMTLLISGLFFIASLFLIPLLPQGFIPPDDNSQTQVYLELPPGSTLAQTQQVAEQARAVVAQVPHVRSIYTTIGGGAAGGDPFAGAGLSDVRKATLTIALSPRGERPVKQKIENEIRQAVQQVSGARSKVGLGGSGEKFTLVLSGQDGATLQKAAAEVEKDLRTLTGVGQITSSASLVRPEIVVRPDFARMADQGITSAAIGETLRVATLGDYDETLPKLNLSERQIPIRVRLDDSVRQDPSALARIQVPGPQGPVALEQVATIELTSGPAQISRYDRLRNVNFDVELAGMPLGDLAAKVKTLPSLQKLPAGVAVREVGDAEMMEELFASFGLAMLTGVLCIYIVLVLLFKNFLHPVTILVALPLALGGAFIALLVAQKSFSMPSLIGLIMLMGIATKNSILLVEYAIVARREQGLSPIDALLDACHKRARPIIMTTIAMGAGMMPLALGLGQADPSFRSPMAVAVIGGLITSTVLSLLVVPAVYLTLDNLKARRQQLGAWLRQRLSRRRA